jgi:Tfp pilus assembly protein PilN
MRYDLNFWPEVDWKREGSLDPRFLMAVVLCLLLMGIGGFWSIRYHEVQVQISQLAELKGKNERIVKDAQEVTRQKECLDYWNGILGRVNGRTAMRMPLSRQLAAVAASIPDSVVLTSLSFHSQYLRLDSNKLLTGTAGAKEKPATFLQYDCRIDGMAYGDQAEATVTRLSRSLQWEDKTGEIAPWLSSAQLAKIEAVESTAEGRPQAASRRFALSLQYKPLDWCYEQPEKNIR